MDHSYTLLTERIEDKVEIYLDGEKIVETTNAIRLFEEGHDPVIYVPKNDVQNIDLIKFQDYDCPHKGHAELYIVKHGARDIENAAWSYDEPFTEVQELQGRVAFYPNKVDEIRFLQ